MQTKNKLAKEWYKVTYCELANLIQQHYQINQASPFHHSLPGLAARIKMLMACCELWVAVANYNATQKFFKGG